VIVRWSPLAIDRVVEIGEWIASERPAAASRIVDDLFDAVVSMHSRYEVVAFQSSMSAPISVRFSSNNSALSTRSPKRTSTFSQFGTCCS
jgi:hypothetical protein